MYSSQAKGLAAGSLVVSNKTGKVFTVKSVKSDGSVVYTTDGHKLLSSGVSLPVQGDLVSKSTVSTKGACSVAKSSVGGVVSCAVTKLTKNVVADTHDAAWRTAARQSVRAFKAPLSAFLLRQNVSPLVTGWLTSQADTEMGEAGLALLLGYGLSYVPQLQCDPKFARLSKELRVLGLEHFVGRVAEAVLLPLRHSLSELVAGMPLDSSGLPADHAAE